ncbi:hypothetical protein AB0B13_33035 [Streptomyces sp. NPDC042898]|uniref:hypothetical protein n=1 Tax=Streptomyces sp. NPDC042898 TaxID=3154334 RepID=UPI0033C6462A
MTRPSLPNPLTPVGYRRDGRPIYPILGASPEHDPNKPNDDPAAGGVTQDDLSRLLAREKTQGGRAAVKKLLDGLGFADTEKLTEFVTATRDAERAALSEVERREQAAEDKLHAAEAREAQAEPSRNNGAKSGACTLRDGLTVRRHRHDAESAVLALFLPSPTGG